ncbi:preprotein translocase subunit YajC [bacterium]|jgi:preprotein translocase subunit YajC|nr:preprotein translocase subunit YajC [bacterium]
MILLQAQSGTASLIMFGLIFVVMYFFMIRPQIKKQKAENQYRASLKMGDKIITIGGIQGKIIEIGKSSVVIEVYGGSKLKVLKSAVSMSGESEIKTK